MDSFLGVCRLSYCLVGVSSLVTGASFELAVCLGERMKKWNSSQGREVENGKEGGFFGRGRGGGDGGVGIAAASMGVKGV